MTGVLFFATSLGLLTTADVGLAEETITEEIEDALEGDWGQILFNLRYRFEHVEQDNLETANGDPVRQPGGRWSKPLIRLPCSVSDNLNILYTAEYAAQSDYGDNPKDFTADYYHVIDGLMAPNSGSLLTKISGKIGYEVYGSDKSLIQ